MSDWKALEDVYVLPTYEKFPFVLERGEGCWVWDDAGTKYLDLYGGHAVAALGHSPKEVADALTAQAGKLLFYSNLVYIRARAEAAKALVEFCGETGSQVFFCNSGAEANENAMRIARSVTGRPKIVAAEGGFHGRTAGAISVTGAKYRKGLAGLGADVVHVPFGDLAAAEKALGPGRRRVPARTDPERAGRDDGHRRISEGTAGPLREERRPADLRRGADGRGPRRRQVRAPRVRRPAASADFREGARLRRSGGSRFGRAGSLEEG